MHCFKKGRLYVALAFSLLGLVLLFGCQPAQPVATPRPAEKPAEKAAATPAKPVEKPVRGGTLRILETTQVRSLDPNTVTANGVLYGSYEQLIEPDKDVNLTKDGLVKDWTPSSDGKAITFKLREGVKFHDSTDFNAEAVKFNIDRMKDPASKSPFSGYYEYVASVDVVDPLTVRFNLKQPDTLLLPQMAGGAGGLMASPAAVKKYGQDFPRNPVGTGPFQFVKWEADTITFKRFEGYWKKDKEGNQLPYVDQVVYSIMTDENTVSAVLRTGQADLMANVPSVVQPLIKSDPNLVNELRPGAVVNAILLNTKKAPFDNKALRQAVALALDREELANAYGGTVNAWASLFSPVQKKAYDAGEAGTLPGRDLAKARAKMAEAGYPSGGVKVVYTTQGTTETARKDAEVAKAKLAEIGIDVEIELLAGAAGQTKVRDERNYQIGTGNLALDVGEPQFFNFFRSDAGRNYTQYSNPQVDAALDKARATYDQKQRAAAYQQAAKILVDDATHIPMYQAVWMAAWNKKVRNYVQVWDSWTRLRDAWLAQ